MSFGNFIDVVSLLQIHGYWILILATIIEGPVATAAGAFAASLGILNLFLVILISFLGDIIADTFYFFTGRVSRKHVIEKYGHKFGFNKKKLKKLEMLLKKHFMKTLLMIKITPLLAPPGIMMIGASRGISFKKFMLSSLMITIPVSLFFAVMGYQLGLAFDSFFKYYKIARELLLIIVLLVALIAYLVEKKVFTKIATRLEKI